MEMDPKCKDKYNLDHVYCHTNENFIRTTTNSDSGSGSSTSTDILAIIKENRQLKAMLLLHLDLIQEQSDQLMAKDKMITSLKDELDSSKRRSERLEKQLNNLKVTMNTIQQQQQQQVQQNQQKHIQQQEFTSKSNSLNNNLIEKVSPVSRTARLSETTSLAKRENSNLSPTMSAQMAHNYEQLQKQSKYKICDEIFDNDSIIGEKNGKFISKIILQRVPMSKGSHFMNQMTTSTSTSTVTKSIERAASTESTIKSSASLLDPSSTSIKMTVATSSATATTTSTMKTKSMNFMTIPATKQSTISPNEIKTKHKEVELTDDDEDLEEENDIDEDDEDDEDDEEEFETHENNSKTGSESVYSPNRFTSSKTPFSSLTAKNEQIDTEDSFSCGSGEQDQHQDQDERDNNPHFQLQIHHRSNLPQKRSRHQSSSITKYSSRKYNILTTKRHYPTREWEWDHVNEETNSKDEAEALKSETPNLEIPKWTIKEFTGLYSIEGTEDLSDDIFTKRHAKLECDEKRRKKWDVQRIREQRAIERLKRRHCKDEVQDSEVNSEITSFFPTADSIKYIYLTEDLPVQAFGDAIPRLPSTEFNLPWQSYNFHRKLPQQNNIAGVNNAISNNHYQKSTSSAIQGNSVASLSSNSNNNNSNILNNTINNSNSIITLDNIGNSCSSNHYPFGHNSFSSVIEVVESPQSTLTFMKKRRKQSSQSQTTSQSKNLSRNLRKLNRNN